ncbi:MAG: hypothetical protein SGJ19_04415 [Planctomycetia bacterium]|nr:hypothetical protein [Planctomycetia bacterium]
MSRSAQLAAIDFVRLAGEGTLGLYGEHFFASGTDALPDAIRRQYPGLNAWRGVSGLKTALRNLAKVDAALPVWLGQRSAVLMRCAARMIVARCEKVLVPDTAWPPFLTILRRECRHAGREIVRVRIRDDIFKGETTADEIEARLCERYRSCHCDGLFLTAVSSEGIRLPNRHLAERLASQYPVRFVVVDGAQEFCQVPSNLDGAWCDLYVAGCHKWLGAYQPMAIALAGRPMSAQWIAQMLRPTVRAASTCDPLLRFSQQLETADLDGVSETVNVAPLFSCQGALQDVPATDKERKKSFEQRLANAREVAASAMRVGWHPLLPHREFCSGILLLQSEREQVRARPASALCDLFRNFGIVVTAYDDGLVRLSMPARPWLPGEINQITEALRQAT